MAKRKRPPSDEESSPEPTRSQDETAKKPKLAAEPSSPSLSSTGEPAEVLVPVDRPLPKDPLRISALRWEAKTRLPIIWSIEGDDERVPYGSYADAIPPSTYLVPRTWSAKHEAFVYTVSPPHAARFTYRRSTYIGGFVPPLYGSPAAIFGDAEQQDPLLLVHRVLPASVCSAFRAERGEASSIGGSDGPPFVYEAGMACDTHIVESVPGHATCVGLGMPDLEMHRKAWEEQVDDESSEEEDDDGDGDGDLNSYAKPDENPGRWTGRWSRVFIERARTGQPLAHLDKVLWDYDGVWGVRVRLVPLADGVRTICDGPEEGEGKARLQSYRIQATILDVYVTPKFFEEVGVDETPQGNKGDEEAEIVGEVDEGEEVEAK
ncbi:hypothetical protein EVG20_g7879 [Dentipellis fragilis]|uniref:Uncharacterized protein n=1 Tax=Dentipellis fragilis TaxID=205917 RepID=A0A4Y9YAX0_9AGAM|nr:hypothetical protein EVG20_g7879 [Dentipellis fragilis]